jgi:hypothetical protein
VLALAVNRCHAPLEPSRKLAAAQVDVQHRSTQISMSGVLSNLIDGPLGSRQIGETQVPERVS